MVSLKKCTMCQENKDLSYFCKQSKSTDGLSYYCKECRKQYRKNRYNLDLNKSGSYNNFKLAERINWIQSLKLNTPCLDCKLIYDPYCMDYDHVPDKGKKVKSISRMVLEKFSKDIILKEINKKCVLVCLLCHNKRTHDRFNEKMGLSRIHNKYCVRNIEIINNFKNKPCTICNKQYDHYNMNADHIDPSNKLYNISQLKNRKIKILEVELEKCQVLCALCHRIKSINEQKEGKYLIKKSKIIKNKLFYDKDNGIKECGICHDHKLISEFKLRNGTNKLNYDTYCKKCFNQYRRNRRKIKETVS